MFTMRIIVVRSLLVSLAHSLLNNIRMNLRPQGTHTHTHNHAPILSIHHVSLLPILRDPLAQFDVEKREHEIKMKKMEQEMEEVFEMKVQEKLQKLKDIEADVCGKGGCVYSYEGWVGKERERGGGGGGVPGLASFSPSFFGYS